MARTLTHWGTYDVTVEGGRIVSVDGIAEDTDPSPIGQSLIDTVDHPVRVRRPAVRRGFVQEVASGRRGRDRGRRRGDDAFIEVPWDEAIDLVAAELDRVRSQHGNEAIFAGSYGWASAGRFHNPQTQLYRLLNLVGGFTYRVNSYSYAAAEVLTPHLVAPFFQLLGEHTSFEQLAAHGRLMVAFGGLPSKNQQVENGGTYRHLAPPALRAMAEAGVRLVNVSPLRGDTDADLGAEWLPIRPGTDTALMLALGHTLVTERLHDQGFLDRYCHGSERFIAYLRGESDGIAKSARWAAPICGVPAERIVALARDLADGPSMVNVSWSLQRAEFGEQPFAAVIALAALLGQIGTPGGGFGLGYGSVNRMGSAESVFSLAGIPVGRNPVETFIPVARITELLEDPGGTVEYDGAPLRLPDTRLVYWAGGNPFHHHQDLNRLAAAWQQPECVIVHEQAWNPLARHADIVLPASTTLERNDFGTAPLTGSVVAMPQVVSPLGEARSDFAICAALAARLGVGPAFTEGLDEGGWLRRLWEDSTVRARQRGLDLPPFDEFWDKGVAELARPPRPRVLLDAFRADPGAHPLSTPSGRIELCSDVLDAFELADCPPHATWLEPVEWLGAPLAERFPLHLISNQPTTRLHSQLDYGRTSLAGKVAGREPLQLNPADAAARGIVAGSVVEVFNDRGRCLAGAVLSDGVMAGVVVLPTGGWYDPVEPGGLCANGNPNVLTSARPTSALAQGPGSAELSGRGAPVVGPRRPARRSSLRPPTVRRTGRLDPSATT